MAVLLIPATQVTALLKIKSALDARTGVSNTQPEYTELKHHRKDRSESAKTGKNPKETSSTGTISNNKHREYNGNSTKTGKTLNSNMPPESPEKKACEGLDPKLKKTLDKLYNAKEYKADDIEDTVECICTENKLDFKNHCVVGLTSAGVNAALEKIKTERPLYIFYWESLFKCWTLTVIAKDKDEDYIMFKHPIGKDIDEQLHDVIISVLATKYKPDHFRINKVDSCGGMVDKNKKAVELEKDVKNKEWFAQAYSGPLVVRYFRFLHNDFLLKGGLTDSFYRSFETYKFSTAEDVDKEKLEIAEYQADVLARNNADFVNSYKKLFGNLNGFVQLNHNLDEYLTEVSQRESEDHFPDEKITLLKRKKYKLDSPNDKKVCDEMAEYAKENEKQSPLNENYYKTEKTCLAEIMTIIKYCVGNTAQKGSRESLTKKFAIPEKVIDKMLKVILPPCSIPLPPKENNINDNNDKIDKDIHLIEQPGPNELPDGITSVKEIVAEVIFGATKFTAPKVWTEAQWNEAIRISGSDAQKLYSYYTVFKQETDLWLKADIREVTKWAEDNKGNLKKQTEVMKALAAANRALKEVKKYTLRFPQACSCIIMLLMGKEDHGKLLQINTGEGKTFTVGLTAAVLALRGKKVDVITSNNILANEGVEETMAVSKLLGVTVGSNDRYFEFAQEKEKLEKDFNYRTEIENKFTTANMYSVDEKEFKRRLAWYNGHVKYTHNVVYGCISTFQFDYLKDKIEGKNERKKRIFDYAVLDEVDSMLIDNGGHVAKLAEPFPGMECMREVYMKIWIELKKQIKSTNADLATPTLEKYNTLLDQNKSDFALAEDKFEEYMKNVLEKKDIEIKDAIKKAFDVKKLKLAPDHIKGYIEDKLSLLIDNAYFAMYGCENEKNFIIEGESIPEDPDTQTKGAAANPPIRKLRQAKVVPVDNANTGVTLKDTIWSYGLHQFVQLKHNLQLTFETLTTSFISNLGYVRLYGPGNGKTGYRIFGVTGSMGTIKKEDPKDTISEKQVFGTICNKKVSFFGMPPYIKSRFKPTENVVVEDAEWLMTVIVETMHKIRDCRSVLIICECIKDVENLYYMFKQLELDVNPNPIKDIRKLSVEKDAGIATEKCVECQTVIIATNLAGRGTDFKTTKCLNDHGGIHVIVGFLPCNARVQDQAFGRTARQGNNGSASMVLRKIELTNKPATYKSFEDVIKERDDIASEKLTKINNDEIPVITFKDQLFNFFATEYLRVKKNVKSQPGGLFLLRDIKERWAFWLEEQDEDPEVVKKQNCGNLFNVFKKNEFSQLTPLNLKSLNTIPLRNPYYDVLKMRDFCESGDWDKAKEVIENMQLSDKDKEIMFSYHMCKFEVEYQSDHNVLLETLKNKFKIEKLAFEMLDKKIEPTYKTRARANLLEVEKALKVEMDYIKDKLKDEDFHNYVIEGAEYLMGETFKHEDNELLTHMGNRWKCLNILKINVEELRVLFLEKDTTYIIFQKVSLDNEDLKEKFEIKNDEVKYETDELHDSGLGVFYTLKSVGNPDWTLVGLGFGSIAAGVALLAVSFFCPATKSFAFDQGLDLVQGGIIDVIWGLLLKTDGEKTDAKDYIMEKLKSAANTALNHGASVVGKLNNKLVCKIMKYYEKINTVVKVLQTAFKLFGDLLPVNIKKTLTIINAAISLVQGILSNVQTSNKRDLNSRKDFINEVKGGLGADLVARFKDVNTPKKILQINAASQEKSATFIQAVGSNAIPIKSGIDLPTWVYMPKIEINEQYFNEILADARSINELVTDICQLYLTKAKTVNLDSTSDDTVEFDSIKGKLNEVFVTLIGKSSKRTGPKHDIPQGETAASMNKVFLEGLSKEIMRRVEKVLRVMIAPPKLQRGCHFFNQVSNNSAMILDLMKNCQTSNKPNYLELCFKELPKMENVDLEKALMMTQYKLFEEKGSERYVLTTQLINKLPKETFLCKCKEELRKKEIEKQNRLKTVKV